MKTGQLRTRLLVEVLSLTAPQQNTVGEVLQVWAPDAHIGKDGYIWGSFEPLSSREFPIAQRMNPETTGRFRIRYEASINSLIHRIVYSGKRWNIRPPLFDQKKTEMTIEAFSIEKPEDA